MEIYNANLPEEKPIYNANLPEEKPIYNANLPEEKPIYNANLPGAHRISHEQFLIACEAMNACQDSFFWKSGCFTDKSAKINLMLNFFKHAFANYLFRLIFALMHSVVCV